MVDTGEKPRTGMSLRRLLPLLVIVCVAVFGFVFLRDFLSFQQLSDNREALNVWRDENFLLAALTFIGIYVCIVAFSLPGATVMTLSGGFLFGLFPGVFFNVTGATIGAIGIFLAARLGLGDALQSKLDNASGTATKIRDGIRANEIPFLFLMRLVPAFPFFAANLVPALCGVNLRNFAFTTFFGIMPGALVYTWVGSGLGEVFARDEVPNLGIIFEWQFLAPILALCALAALPIGIKYFRKGAA